MNLKLYIWNMVLNNDRVPYTLYAIAKDEQEAKQLIIVSSKDDFFGDAVKDYIEKNRPIIYDKPAAFIRHGHASYLP